MAVPGAWTIHSPERLSRHLSGSPLPATRGNKGWLAISAGKTRISSRETRVFGDKIFLSEEIVMGMIAFYAGLFIGILLGFLLASLLSFSLAKPKAGALPDQADGYSPVDLLKP